MADEASFTGLSDFKTGLDTFIVKPAGAFGLAGFEFGVDRTVTVKATSDITDHYVEDNSVLNDHIALRPETVTLGQYVGEVLYEGKDKGILGDVQDVLQKLTAVSAMIPAVISSASAVKGLVTGASPANATSIFDTTTNLWSLTKNLMIGSTEQGQAYAFFDALRTQKALVSIETPYKFFTDMAIQTISATQGETSEDISDFSITLKKVRKVKVKTVKYDEDEQQGRGASQRATEINNGKAQGTTKSTLFSKFADKFKVAE